MHWPKATVLGFSDDNYESKGHIYGPYNTAKPHLYNGGVQGASGPLVGLVIHLKYTQQIWTSRDSFASPIFP